MIIRRATLASLAVTGALIFAGSTAVAATRVVAPGAARQANPCTSATPCDYYWAITHSSSGDTVAFESGQYTYDGSVHTTSLGVPAGVTLSRVAGDATRPVIKQTVGYASCNCATLAVGGTLEDLEVDQAAGTVGHTAGAIEMSAGAVVERALLVGRVNGMYVAGGPGTARLGDSVVVAHDGVAVETFGGGVDPVLDNVTAIAHGAGTGVALEVDNTCCGALTQLDATNTIARGDVYDALVDASAGDSTMFLHYSDARTAMEHTEGTGGTPAINDSDHPMHADPLFASATDYTEAASSPTIDAGTADAASGSLDLSGLPRTIGPATDIGATEFGGAAPVATTGTSSIAGPGSATLAGTVTPKDLQTTWYFEYGTTAAYGSTTPAHALTPTMAGQPVSEALSGLTPGTTYHFRLVATNALGPSAGADATFTTASGPLSTPPQRDKTPPTVSSLAVSPSTFAVAKGHTATLATTNRRRHHQGAKITFKLSERARVVIAFARKATGIKVGRSCMAPSRKHRRGKTCVRYAPSGSLVRRSEPGGTVRIAFTGRVGARALRPGHYRLTLTATDPAGNPSRARSVIFTIVSR
jgi:hypothetical protein